MLVQEGLWEKGMMRGLYRTNSLRVSMTSSIGVLPLMRWLETTGQNPTTAAGVTLKSRTECLQVHQVDAVRLQPPQGRLDSNADELGIVSELTAAIGPDIVAKLGGQEDLPGRSVQQSHHTKGSNGGRTSSRLPVRSNHFPSRSSLSPYRAAESQCLHPSSCARSRSLKRSSSGGGVP